MTRILARVGAKGQTVIPKPVRDELGLRPGDGVYFSTHGGHAHIEPADGRKRLEELFGKTPGVALPHDLDIDAVIDEAIDADLSEEMGA